MGIPVRGPSGLPMSTTGVSPVRNTNTNRAGTALRLMGETPMLLLIHVLERQPARQCTALRRELNIPDVPTADGWNVLLTFHDFPAEHWTRLRTTNLIESTFAAVRPQDEQTEKRLRAWRNRGCPLGSDSLPSKLESHLSRRLHPRPGGRPKKEPQDQKNNGLR